MSAKPDLPPCPFCGANGLTSEYNSFGTHLYCADGCHGRFTFPAFEIEVRRMWKRTAKRSAPSAETKDGERALLGMDTPWPADLLFKALVTAERILCNRGYDGDGWEALQTAAQVAESRLSALRAAANEQGRDR